MAYLEGIQSCQDCLKPFPGPHVPPKRVKQRPTSLYHLRQAAPLPENGATSQTRPTMAPVYASAPPSAPHWRLIPISAYGKCSHPTRPRCCPFSAVVHPCLLYTPTPDAPVLVSFPSAYLSQALTQASRLFLSTSHLSWTWQHHISTLRPPPSSQHMPICHQPSLGEQNGSREAGPLHLGCLVHYKTSCLSTPAFPIHEPWDGGRGVAVQWWPRGNRGRALPAPQVSFQGHFSSS